MKTGTITNDWGEVTTYDLEKLQRALDSLEMKANYINIDYYKPKYDNLLNFCIINNLEVTA